MTPTSEERREVARKLREDLPVARNVQEGYVAIMQTIGVRPCLLMVEGQSGDRFDVTAYEEGAARLADLIDPTCYLVDTTSTDGLHGPIIFSHELSCGNTCETFWREPPAYCTECGARVVDDGLD